MWTNPNMPMVGSRRSQRKRVFKEPSEIKHRLLLEPTLAGRRSREKRTGHCEVSNNIIAIATGFDAADDRSERGKDENSTKVPYTPELKKASRVECQNSVTPDDVTSRQASHRAARRAARINTRAKIDLNPSSVLSSVEETKRGSPASSPARSPQSLSTSPIRDDSLTPDPVSSHDMPRISSETKIGGERRRPSDSRLKRRAKRKPSITFNRAKQSRPCDGLRQTAETTPPISRKSQQPSQNVPTEQSTLREQSSIVDLTSPIMGRQDAGNRSSFQQPPLSAIIDLNRPAIDHRQTSLQSSRLPMEVTTALFELLKGRAIAVRIMNAAKDLATIVASTRIVLELYEGRQVECDTVLLIEDAEARGMMLLSKLLMNTCLKSRLEGGLGFGYAKSSLVVEAIILRLGDLIGRIEISLEPLLAMGIAVGDCIEIAPFLRVIGNGIYEQSLSVRRLMRVAAASRLSTSASITDEQFLTML